MPGMPFSMKMINNTAFFRVRGIGFRFLPGWGLAKLYKYVYFFYRWAEQEVLKYSK